MAEVGIRQWLKDNGYAQNDDDITYNNGTVFLKGRQFTNATPKADGSTYGDASSLANAYKAYQTQGLQNEVSNTLGQYKNMMAQNQQRTPFNPSTDTQYQTQLATALANAQKGAQTAQNNALVGLGSRGIGNSSVAVDRSNQIQQQAFSNVSQNLMPQMMAQAYQRYMDDQQLKQQDLGNIGNYLGLANNLYQQGADNDYRDKTFAETQKQNNLDLAKWGVQTYGYGDPKSDAGVFFNQYNGAKTLANQQMDTQNNQWQTQFDYGKTRDSVTDSQWLKQFGASQANAAADNARQSASLGLQREQFNWSKDPNNPDNLYRMAQLRSLGQETQKPSDYKTSPDFAEDLAGLQQMGTEQALDVLTKQAQAFVQEYGYDGYMALRNMFEK